MSGRYARLRLLGRDVVAVPSHDASLRQRAVATLPDSTWRARLVRAVVGGVMRLGVERLISVPSDSPAPQLTAGEWTALLDRLSAAAPGEVSDVVVVHPPRRDRLYVHLFDASARRSCFAKVAPVGSGGELEAEERAIAELAASARHQFRVPQVRASGTTGAQRWLLFEPLPSGTRLAPPRWTRRLQSVQRDLGGPPRRHGSLRELSWWPSFEATSGDVPALARAARLEQDVAVRSVVAHGDFVNWNIHLDQGSTWIVDWESYCPDAPVLADPVRFFLGVRTRRVGAVPQRVAAELRRRFCQQLGHPERALVRALAFLHARQVEGATLVAQRWRPTSPEAI